MWKDTHHLVDLGWREPGENTFVAPRRGGEVGSRIDHVYATAGVRDLWCGRGGGTLRTLPVADRAWGHRALWMDGRGDRVLPWLSLNLSSNQWRRQKAAARRAAHRARPPPRIDKDREQAFAAALGEKLDMGLLSRELQCLQTIGTWGGGLWEGRASHTNVPMFLNAQGVLVTAERLETGVPMVWLVPAGFVSAGAMGDFHGWGASKVLEFVEACLTRCESVWATAMVDSAWTLGKQDKASTPMLSRRRLDGWFPTIGEERRAVEGINRVHSWVARGWWGRARDEVRRLNQRGSWKGPPVPARDSPGEWDEWAVECMLARQKLKHGLHASKRRARRGQISEAVDKREANFAAGNFRHAVSSVLRRSRGGALQFLQNEDGTMETDPVTVKQQAADHFRDCFDGAGTTPWFQDPPQAQAVQDVYEDSAAGRKHREELLEGRVPQCWDNLPEDDRLITRMLKRKEIRREPDQPREPVQEEWYDGVMGDIQLEEWERYWGKKGRYTSAGRTGVRPDMLKAAPKHVHEVLVALYNVCLKLKAFPLQWKERTVVPIPKKPGAVGLGDLRPLKLLEITRKAVMGIIKDRVKRVMEERGVLHSSQHGFRARRHTATAAMTLLTMVEDARLFTRDLHVLCVDIRKAYDTVIRAVGTEGALRRLGVPLEVAELLMEAERANRNDVRTACGATKSWKHRDPAPQNPQTPTAGGRTARPPPQTPTSSPWLKPCASSLKTKYQPSPPRPSSPAIPTLSDPTTPYPQQPDTDAP